MRPLLILTLVVQSVFAVKPSFECKNASTRTQILICKSDELSDLDQRLSTIYKDLEKNLSAPVMQKVRVAERKWIEERALCANGSAVADSDQVVTKCLISSFQIRIEELAVIREQASSPLPL